MEAGKQAAAPDGTGPRSRAPLARGDIDARAAGERRDVRHLRAAESFVEGFRERQGSEARAAREIRSDSSWR
jgi:hypothetical protein